MTIIPFRKWRKRWAQRVCWELIVWCALARISVDQRAVSNPKRNQYYITIVMVNEWRNGARSISISIAVPGPHARASRSFFGMNTKTHFDTGSVFPNSRTAEKRALMHPPKLVIVYFVRRRAKLCYGSFAFIRLVGLARALRPNEHSRPHYVSANPQCDTHPNRPTRNAIREQ